MKKFLSILCCAAAVFCFSTASAAKEPLPAKVPDYVADISKENTYPNPSHDQSELVPSGYTKSLLQSSKVAIDNPALIKLLNESSLHPSKWSIAYSARIYLGEWPLSYTSKETTVNWEYKKISDNAADARGSTGGQKLSYTQENEAKVTGGLTANVPKKEEVSQLIMAKAMKKTRLPISFSTVVGRGTKADRPYQVDAKHIGHLYGYVPAVNEKGKITYGEVFLVLKGGKAFLEVKNVMEQGIGAWMPIQDHVSLRYLAK
ncbi:MULTISPECIES: YfkD family protein [unclassified Sporolactobacillus]|uniref:YfkD family protein n=1 Tax=unclassified Sporolactobacillus TaxID=2628533 RepID=UPI002368BD6F|nr:YfkD family protein [Sporolactobacillus sp. CQH2019]MDD9150385.1 YfkD family protein [Sporolactobacillus sp. CQH2019]